ncbi:MAG: hypothetical protein EPN85_08230 [Bacteroidetes bacterium]|nr:MAG: hypothetical protein EPN85_08230 [Bacteroidota bacterium]
MSKKILIVCYYFPPSTLVAGRRWAKFAKYLSKSGYDIFVVAAKSETKIGLWDEDVSAFKNNITYLDPKIKPKFYFKKKIEYPLSIIDKVRFKLSYYSFLVWRFFMKGFFYDPSIGCNRSLKSAILSIKNEQKIDAIIVSGGPFRWCYYVSKIVSDHLKTLPLIIDLRDFWANGSPMQNLSPEKVRQEKYFEEYSLSKATVILTVNELIAAYISNTYPKLSSKISVIPHAFDEEDFKYASNRVGESNLMSINLAYAGSLYPKMEFAIALLKELLIALREKRYKASVYFFTSSSDYSNLFENEIKDSVIYKPLLKPTELFETLSRNIDVVLQPRASVMLEENFKSSKFYEQIALRKPILYIGIPSELSDYYQNNKLGYALTSSSDVERISDEIINNLSTKIIPDKTFDLSVFTFEKQVRKISRILETLISANQSQFYVNKKTT